MNTTDHDPVDQLRFRGLYSRGKDDAAPPDFLIDCLNNKYGQAEVSSRDGSELALTKVGIRRFFVYKRLNENPRFIILDSNGNFFDSLAPGTPIYTDAAITDFSMVNYANRAYISPHNRLKGAASKSLLVYEGTGNARLAAGTAPTGFTLGVANAVGSGNVEAGYHIFAQAFITSSGFITAPGPAVWTILNCPGGKAVNFSSIGLGGSSVVARVLLATKSIPTTLYNGNQYAYELFFIPNTIIANNTATTLNGVSFFDADLLTSADYLIDNLATIPAGLGVIVYNNRLLTWAESGNEFTIRGSSVAEPEVFSSVAGFITVDPSDAVSGIKNCFEHRKALIINTANRIYHTADNGSDLTTWEVNNVDKSVGLECFTVATVLDSRGTNTDRAFIGTKAGLISYEGYAKRPELSWNIEDVWGRINKLYFNLTQVVDDPINHRMFISVALDAATTISHLLYADYSQAFTVYGTLDEKAIKWSIWTFPSAPISIVGDLDSTTGLPVLHVALTGGIYTIKPGLRNDFSTAIDSFIKTSLRTVAPGWVNHCDGIILRVVGSGSLALSLTGEDNANSQVLTPLILASAPGYEPWQFANFMNEKVSLKCRVSSINEWYTINKTSLSLKALWAARAK